ncbi:MAG: NHL repeat-containing protein [Saccharofermentanales bacterium]
MKKVSMFIIIMLLIMISAMPVFAIKPYQNYIYDHNRIVQEEPQAVIPSAVITGASLNTRNFNNPQDVFVAEDGRIYIADTGNNRILIIDGNFRLIKVIDSFINTENNDSKDQFNAPTGIFVTPDDFLYIADSQNGRIVVLNNDASLYRLYGKPSTPLISGPNSYVPLKVAVDSMKRLNIVARGQENGIIQLENDGSFIGFFGAIPTPPDLYNMIIRLFGTEDMKKSMVFNISTVYSNVTVDADDFIYGTVGKVDLEKYNISNIVVRKLNPNGNDILKRFGNMPVYGDGQYIDYSVLPLAPVAPYIADIAVNDNGIYSILDQRSGHIFTYDYNGNLLFNFGTLASDEEPTLGQFGIPSAFDFMKNNEFIVVDSKYNQLVTFKLTVYGQMLANIIDRYNELDYNDVNKYWKTALKYTSKSELLYNYIGQAYYKQTDYKNAMKYFKLAENRTMYSKAYTYLRKRFMSKYFSIIVVAASVFIILIVAGIKISSRYRRKRRG